jgi:hypothetical protein
MQQRSSGPAYCRHLTRTRLQVTHHRPSISSQVSVSLYNCTHVHTTRPCSPCNSKCDQCYPSFQSLPLTSDIMLPRIACSYHRSDTLVSDSATRAARQIEASQQQPRGFGFSRPFTPRGLLQRAVLAVLCRIMLRCPSTNQRVYASTFRC